MPGPLSGLRVIDLTEAVAGPLATMILGDQGADVIKVEIPGRGDQTRKFSNQSGGLSASFLNNNRNKRSLALNLKDPRGRAVLERLAADADALVQNFRPGVVERLGIDEAAIRRINPNIVYVSISGFGRSGPWSHKPVYDPIVQGLSGLCTIQGGSDEARPRLVRTIVPDKVTALNAAQAVTAALLARERTGKGQHVELSMLDSVLAFLWSSDMGGQTYADRPLKCAQPASFIDLIYETADGYISVAVMTDAQWANLAHAVERPEWIEDPRFVSAAQRDENIDDRLALTQEALRTRTTAVWLERLEANDVPCGPVLARNDVITHPQVTASETVVEYDHPVAGRLRQSRPPARFDQTPAGINRGAPSLGEHNVEILAEAGLSESDIAELRQAGVVSG